MIYRHRRYNKNLRILLVIVVTILLGGGVVLFSSNSPLYPYMEELKKEKSNQDLALKNPELVDNYGLPMVVIQMPEGKTLEDLNEIEKVDNSSNLGEKETALPGGSVASKYPRVRLNCDLSIYTMEEGEYKIDTQEEILFGLRGQSSLTFPKKQFAVNFIDENGEEKNAEPLGFAQDNSFVLNGSYVDNSAIRNYLAYTISDEIVSTYSPKVQYCEVYVLDDNNKVINDGSYQGVYLFMEKNTRGENRIDIKKNDEKYIDISFIIARDKSKIGDVKADTLWSKVQRSVIVKAGGIVVERSGLVVNYPDAEVLQEEDLKAIQEYINDFEYALYSSDFRDEKKGYRRFIDIESFIDYAIINEVFNNTDGGDVSTFFYKDVGGKLTAGPVWDFDLILGNTITSEVPTYDGFRMYNTVWFDQMFKDPYFVKRYKARYKTLRETVLSVEHLNEVIDEGLNELGPALERNRERWYTVEAGYKYDVDSMGEIEKIKEYLKNRLEWMDENLSILLRKDYE